MFKNYKLVHPYYYPTNHTQAGVTSAGPCILGLFVEDKKFAFLPLLFCTLISSNSCKIEIYEVNIHLLE